MPGRKDQLPASTIMYDWDKNVKAPDEEDVAEYRAIEMEDKYPLAVIKPWSELNQNQKQDWFKRYKHGS